MEGCPNALESVEIPGNRHSLLACELEIVLPIVRFRRRDCFDYCLGGRRQRSVAASLANSPTSPTSLLQQQLRAVQNARREGF